MDVYVGLRDHAVERRPAHSGLDPADHQPGCRRHRLSRKWAKSRWVEAAAIAASGHSAMAASDDASRFRRSETDVMALQQWETFALVIGGAAGALVGLLFVAISIRATTIAASADLRNRAAQTLVIFASLLLVAVLFTVPAQQIRLFGAELLVVAASRRRCSSFSIGRANVSGPHRGLSRVLKAVSPTTVTAVGTAAAGALLLSGIPWGIFFLCPQQVSPSSEAWPVPGSSWSRWTAMRRPRSSPSSRPGATDTGRRRCRRGPHPWCAGRDVRIDRLTRFIDDLGYEIPADDVATIPTGN